MTSFSTLSPCFSLEGESVSGWARSHACTAFFHLLITRLSLLWNISYSELWLKLAAASINALSLVGYFESGHGLRQCCNQLWMWLDVPVFRERVTLFSITLLSWKSWMSFSSRTPSGHKKKPHYGNRSCGTNRQWRCLLPNRAVRNDVGNPVTGYKRGWEVV